MQCIQSEHGHRSLEESQQFPDERSEVAFDGDEDPMNPRSFTMARKWLITLIVASSSFCVTCNSSLYTTTYVQIVPVFNSSREVATLGLTTFVLGLMIGPMFLAPFSEFYGRRPIFIVAFSMVWHN